MAAIYLHIPFCKTRCHYCDFYSGGALGELQSLVDALCAELEANSTFFDSEDPIRTIYFGGGTPSLCTQVQIDTLLGAIRGIWDTSLLEEVTLEANPDDLTPHYLATLRASGINRLSIGIQSFTDEHLQWMNRRHSVVSALQALADARRAGFENISIDLIYALPGLSLAVWDENLLRTVDSGAEHISAYSLTVEPETELGRRAARGDFSPVAEEAARAQFDLLRLRLTDAGYEHYEVSNFAYPGFRARHNSGYWTGTSYLGVGPSAHSYDGKCRRRWNVPDLARFLRELPAGAHFEQEKLSPRDLHNEYLMTRLRTAEGVDSVDFTRRFGTGAGEQFLKRARNFFCTGSMRSEGGRWYIPAESFFISDGIISELFEPE